MSRSTTARKPKLFFCAYGDHGAPSHKRTEHNGATVCADCKSHWEQHEAHLDEVEADIALSFNAANDSHARAELGPGPAVEEALRDLVFETTVMGIECPAEFRSLSTTTLRVADVAALASKIRATFLDCHRALTGAGLHLRAGSLMSSAYAALSELFRWSEQQTRERVEVAS